MISAPGIYPGLTSKAYHADPVETVSLNSSIAKIMCEKSPAHAHLAHPRLGGAKADGDDEKEEKVSKEKLLGLVLHRLLLGAGPEIVVCPYDNWMSGAAKADKKRALAAGSIPTLPHIYDEAQLAAAAARTQLDAMGYDRVFRDGQKEVTLVWNEGDSYFRAMLDQLIIDEDRQTAEVWDLKTVSRSSHPNACAAQISQMGYDFSRVFYKQGLQTVRPDLAGRVKFYWAFLEVKPPYAVTPCEIDGMWDAVALQHYCNAVDAWKSCMASGKWPFYVNKITTLEAKPWMLAAAIGAEIAGNDA